MASGEVERSKRVENALTFSPRAGTLVLQPTPLCNMRCNYCYLSDLGDRSRMGPEIPLKLAADLDSYPGEEAIEIRWHAGEPLTVGVEHFTRLLEPFEHLRSEGRLRHRVQTNATLISDAWCDLFRHYGVGVGVSIDGPRWANGERRALSGAETFERATKGITRLRDHGIRFSAIAVVRSVNVPVIIDRVDSYFSFFRTLGAFEIAFNLEEHEGVHSATPVAGGLVEAFWQALFDVWIEAGGTPRVREFDRVLSFARSSLNGEGQLPADPMPTITHRGDVVLLSPELAGFRDERYSDFVVGSLYDDSLTTILARGLEAPYVNEHLEGTQRCRDLCAYFDYCRGGSASNRYFEHKDFLTHETEFCRHSRQAPFDVVIGKGHPTTKAGVGNSE